MTSSPTMRGLHDAFTLCVRTLCVTYVVFGCKGTFFSCHSRLYICMISCSLVMMSCNRRTGQHTLCSDPVHDIRCVWTRREGQNFSRWSVFKNDRVLFRVHMCVGDPPPCCWPWLFQAWETKDFCLYWLFHHGVYFVHVISTFFQRLSQRSTDPLSGLTRATPKHMQHTDATANFTNWQNSSTKSLIVP